MTRYQDMTDEEVVAAYQAGDFAAVEYICNKYRNVVSKYGKKFFIKGGEEQDVIQEGMVGLFKAIQDYDKDKNVPFYSFAELCISRQIFKAVEAADRLKNQPLNSYISLSPDEETQGEESIASILSRDISNPETMLLDSEKTMATFEQIVDALSKMELQVFFYMMQGYDYRTIAEKMNRDDKKIDNAIQRIRQKVKKIMK